HQAGKWDKESRTWINRRGDLAYHYLIAPSGRVYEGRSVSFAANSNTVYLPIKDFRKAQRYKYPRTEKDKTNRPWGGVSGVISGSRPGAVEGHLTVAFIGTYNGSLPPPKALVSFRNLIKSLLKKHSLDIADVYA